jgi:membrane-associated phospholipid phosphatase
MIKTPENGLQKHQSKQDGSASEPKRTPSRRAFLKGFGAATIASAAGAVTAAAHGVMPDVISDPHSSKLNINARRGKAYQNRIKAAAQDRRSKTQGLTNNGDEAKYSNGIANFTKGFAHDDMGIVDAAPYAAYLAAIRSGKRQDFDSLVMGGTIPLVDPQAGLAFDLETCDPSQNSIPPFDTLSTPGFAAQMIETYWLALTRDVPFSQWGTDSTIAAACTELSGLGSAYAGPLIGGKVTPQSVFRAGFYNDGFGPYVSQFFLQPFTLGVMPFVGYQTTEPGDFGIDPSSWLNIQNGAPNPLAPENPDPTLKYLGTGRDLAEYVHNDVLYQEYLNAALMLAKMRAPLNSGNPYGNPNLKSETGFITFGLPMVQVLVAEVIARAIKNAWFQKWFVHRTARPEETAGLVHYTITAQQNYHLDSSVINSQAAATVHTRTGNYFIPLSYPEGCPLHPSYPSGHATAGGAAATILKWFFADSTPISSLTTPLTTADDGSAPVPYARSDGSQMTVGGEINKLAANVGFGRVFSGIHWRQDIIQGMLLGEKVAINLLQDQAHLYNENYTGFTFTKFDGTQITV